MTAQRDESGSMSLEMVIMIPALVAAILVLTAASRYVEARGQTTTAAYAAARAASLTDTPHAAVTAGRQAAARTLADRGASCARLTVSIDAGGFRPGGDLIARVTCLTDLSDLSGLGLPGHLTLTSRAVVPVEEHRVL